MEAGDFGFAQKGMAHFAIGTRVRGSYGEGGVIGAECTPGDLTQYRIQKADGTRFWAQAQDLETQTGNK
jgi:murein endopeptidase